MNVFGRVRQWMAENAALMTAVLVLIIVGAGWWAWSNRTTTYPPFKMPTAVFYDEETTEFVNLPADKVPPQANARNGGLTVVGTLYADGEPGKDAPTLLFKFDETGRQQAHPMEVNMLIRRPGSGEGESQWVAKFSERGTRLFGRYMGAAIMRRMGGGPAGMPPGVPSDAPPAPRK